LSPAQKPGFLRQPLPPNNSSHRNPVSWLGASRGGSETGFLCRSRWGDRDFAEKPGFLARNLRRT
jgi:hypothetical protein